MNLPSALQYIYDLQRIGIKFGLTNTKRILQALGDPHMDLKVIHISGTNGKGSTAAMVMAILKAAGYKVGLYTSPHLIDLSERIQINGLPIPNEDLIRGAEKIQQIIRRIHFKDSHPTYFETVTCLAFSYFNSQGVDFAVMETGMGGRLDATNVCIPKVTVITGISFDHQEYLGETLKEIAREKAGIIKSEAPLVCGATQKEVLEVIMKQCQSKGVPLYLVSELYRFEQICPKTGPLFNPHPYPNTQSCLTQFKIWRKGKHYHTITTALQGRFQIQNILLALETIERLKGFGVMIWDKAVKDGLKQTVWPGRMQIVSQNPYLVLDGAHNPCAAQSLAEAIQAQFRYKDLVLILGILKDKDIAGICEALLPLASKIILSSTKSDRSASAEELYKIIHKLPQVKDRQVLIIPYLTEAILQAKKIAKAEDLILITGSLYTVGEAMSHLGIRPYPTQVRNCA